MNPDRPLDGVTSIKLKLGLLVGASVVATVLVAAIGDGAGVPWWASLPVTAGAAVGVTQWLARGMTSPLRAMTEAARRMAVGDYGQRVTATSSDEVGQLARTFNAMAADLAGADLERRRLIATVSHELRTPLTAQRALLENLADGVTRPDPDTLRAALAQAERLSALVGDLLDLSRIDAGVAPLGLAPVRVGDLLAAAVEEAGVSGRPVRLRHRVEPADLTVTADPARLAQLVANLADNAVRHSPPYGEVRLHARREGEDRWVLEVGDDGPGISAADAERVFERFGTGSDQAGGTGLGLAIVRWVCELHGGRVEVVPATRGALLRVTLPVSPSTERPTHLREQRTPTPRVTTTAVTTESTSTTPSAPATQETPMSTAVPPASAAPAAPPVPPTAGPVGPYGGGGPGPVETALSRVWPEPDRRPRVGVVGAAAGIGLLAALTWPYRGIGLSTSLVMVATGALMWVVARHRRDPWTIGGGVLALLLALVATLRDAGES
ncbi:HAMP domain-containing histidine kinase [Phycicoccus sp. HDW14]|uniref:HAMP domain-containing sensor histidine kinase n=1 Tax=Phycicoccus sp. HDW14 TaxID=2714941 RepID=UPI001408F44C|nr:HAMP domain-containing sensor histidine kinase [Phycicoccus sp. HDW14]QIM20020.1 HAMP domain-containing histidine kinase [Phycicoccus sp. HDW14]